MIQPGRWAGVSPNFRNEETEAQVSATFMVTKLVSERLDFKPDLDFKFHGNANEREGRKGHDSALA